MRPKEAEKEAQRNKPLIASLTPLSSPLSLPRGSEETIGEIRLGGGLNQSCGRNLGRKVENLTRRKLQKKWKTAKVEKWKSLRAPPPRATTEAGHLLPISAPFSHKLQSLDDAKDSAEGRLPEVPLTRAGQFCLSETVRSVARQQRGPLAVRPPLINVWPAAPDH